MTPTQAATLIALAATAATAAGCARYAHRYDACAAFSRDGWFDANRPIEIRSEFDSRSYARCRTLPVTAKIGSPADLHALVDVQRDLVIGADMASYPARRPEVRLARLQRIDGDLVVGRDGQRVLSRTIVAPALAKVVGDLRIELNDTVTSVSLPSLASIGGDLVIRGTTGLVDVDLPALREVGGDVTIEPYVDPETAHAPAQPNAELRVVGLWRLARVGGSITIARNPRLALLRLDQRLQVPGRVVVEANDGPCWSRVDAAPAPGSEVAR